jgi:hypothetical protein
VGLSVWAGHHPAQCRHPPRLVQVAGLVLARASSPFSPAASGLLYGL